MRGKFSGLTLACASLAIASCDYPVVGTDIAVAFGVTGEPHVAVSRYLTHNYFIEGNSSSYGLGFVSRTSSGANWEQASLLPPSTSTPGAVAVGLDGRDYIAVQSAGRIQLFSRLAGPWAPIVVAPTIDPATFSVSTQSSSINAGWTGTDGIVRFVFARVLLEIEGTTATRAIAIPNDCSRRILNSPNAYVLPSGDRSADVAVFDSIGGSVRSHLATLTCTASDCSWEDHASPTFIAMPGVNEVPACSFFRLADGTPTQACLYEPVAGGHLSVEISAAGRELFQVSDAWLIGAAATHNGGFALAFGPAPNQTGTIVVDFVDVAGHERRFEVERRQVGDALTFGAPPGLQDEAVDLFVGRGNAITRIRVNVANGSTQRDDIALGN